MIKKYGPTIKKLQRAINNRVDEKILINKSQIYSEDSDVIVEVIYIKKIAHQGKRNRYIELFHSASDVQITLFLRDYWYELNGWEVPMDNKDWVETKQKYYEKHPPK